MDLKTLVVDAVRNGIDLPADLRRHAALVGWVEEHRFDQSYIDFLDEQIHLSARGPEWTERLRQRRAALVPFCDVTLVRGRIRTGHVDFYIEVHPETREVVHWEEYEIEAAD